MMLNSKMIIIGYFDEFFMLTMMMINIFYYYCYFYNYCYCCCYK